MNKISRKRKADMWKDKATKDNRVIWGYIYIPFTFENSQKMCYISVRTLMYFAD